jgi:hypothetical protein
MQLLRVYKFGADISISIDFCRGICYSAAYFTTLINIRKITSCDNWGRFYEIKKQTEGRDHWDRPFGL